MRAVAYIPELNFKWKVRRRIKLADSLFLLPSQSKDATNLKEEIESIGYKIASGGYLLFDGELREDGTLYEIFQGYALALTFFQPKRRASCRAVKGIEPQAKVDLFIDEYDQFRYEPEDEISFSKEKLPIVREIYSRVENELINPDFNPLRNALEFFILFLSEKQIRTRLLYLSICLESVLLEGQSEGLAYKLGIRCANFLNAFYTKVLMNEVHAEVRNAYSLRSTIIHGDNYTRASAKLLSQQDGIATELDHVLRLEAIVKDVLSAIFTSQELYDFSTKKSLGKEIDEKYILS